MNKEELHYDVVVYDVSDAERTQQGLQKIEELKAQGKTDRGVDMIDELRLVFISDDNTFQTLQDTYKNFSPKSFIMEAIVDWITSGVKLNDCAGKGYIYWPSKQDRTIRIKSAIETFIYSEDKEA